MASAIKARSPPGKLPFSSSMPALPAVPSRVPTVSKQSQMAKVMIAVRKGTTPPAERAPEKSSLKATSPNASPIPATVKLSGMVVSPIRKPIRVVAMMPIKIAPFTR